MDTSRLTAFPVFAGLPSSELEEVAAVVREVATDAGETVVTVDDFGTGI